MTTESPTFHLIARCLLQIMTERPGQSFWPPSKDWVAVSDAMWGMGMLLKLPGEPLAYMPSPAGLEWLAEVKRVEAREVAAKKAQIEARTADQKVAATG